MGHRLSCLDTTYCSPEKIPKKIPEIRDCWALPLIKNFCEVVPSVLILQTKVKSAVRFRPWCGHTRRKSAVHRPSTSCVGWIPGILGFSAQMNFTQILIVELNQLWKSFRMIPKSPRSTRIFLMKIDFLTFAWAKLWMGSPRKFRGYSQKIRLWIWNILILILRVLLTAEKSSE